MHGIGIRGRMHCYRWNSQLSARTLDSQCDLTAVRDQNFLKQNDTLLDDHQKFAILNRGTVLNNDFRHGSRSRRLDLIERLHGFDQ